MTPFKIALTSLRNWWKPSNEPQSAISWNVYVSWKLIVTLTLILFNKKIYQEIILFNLNKNRKNKQKGFRQFFFRGYGGEKKKKKSYLELSCFIRTLNRLLKFDPTWTEQINRKTVLSSVSVMFCTTNWLL